jgi:protein-tyrosine phosphatase
MKPAPFLIDRDGPGRLATMARPRGGDWLADEVAALRQGGVDVLVSALTDAELALLQLTDEQALAEQAGLTYISFPIPDRAGGPELGAARELVERLESFLDSDQSVVVHCRAGIGRSSLIAAAVLVRERVSPDEAWDRIGAARGLTVPDTDAQREWLSAFQAALVADWTRQGGRNLPSVIGTTSTCRWCGGSFELPPEYISGANTIVATIHGKDPVTSRPTGHVVIMMAGVKAHECWREV